MVHGTTRATLVVADRIAIKFAKGEAGRRANLYERDVYARVNERRRAMLCPVLACHPDGAVLLMSAARILTEAESWALRYRDQYPDWDYASGDDETAPFEYKGADWGWLDGRLVAVDYAVKAHLDSGTSGERWRVSCRPFPRTRE
jgi:hypothetical protein